MKILKTAGSKKTIRISKSEWENIGKKAGWMRLSYKNFDGSRDVILYRDMHGDFHLDDDMGDPVEVEVLFNYRPEESPEYEGSSCLYPGAPASVDIVDIIGPEGKSIIGSFMADECRLIEKYDLANDYTERSFADYENRKVDEMQERSFED